MRNANNIACDKIIEPSVQYEGLFRDKHIESNRENWETFQIMSKSDQFFIFRDGWNKIEVIWNSFRTDEMMNKNVCILFSLRSESDCLYIDDKILYRDRFSLGIFW
jgi:hypothetical protein